MTGWLPTVLLVVGMAACGGGASTPTPTSTASSARVAVGTITGFGSVHVNGVKFETTAAKITINGQAGVQGDLSVSEVVNVIGHHDDATDQDGADTIEFHHDVKLAGHRAAVVGTWDGAIFTAQHASLGDGLND